MTKLNQIIAISQGKKSSVKANLTEIYQKFQKSDLFDGMERTYQPLEDGAEILPSESKIVQYNVDNLVDKGLEEISRLTDLIATQDEANTKAKADIKIDGQLIAKGVCATTLIQIEKQLTDLHTFFSKIPILDQSDNWKFSDASALNETEIIKTRRTQKVQKPIVLFTATKEHPAQTQLITEDQTTGFWQTKKLSSAWSVVKRDQVLERIRDLKEAVISAREEANMIEVEDKKIGENIYGYILR